MMKRSLSAVFCLALCSLMLGSCGLSGGDLFGDSDVPMTSEKAQSSKKASSSSPQQGKASYRVTYSQFALSSRTSDQTSDTLDVLIEVENTGSVDLYLDGASVNLRNPEGTKMLSSNLSLLSASPDVIAPKKKGYFYISIAEQFDMNVDYQMEFDCSLKKARSAGVYLSTSDLTLTDNMFGGIYGSMKVTNTTGAAQSNVRAAAILFDSSDNPFAIIDGGSIDSLSAGDSVMIDLYTGANINRSLKTSDVARSETIAFNMRYFNV